MAEDVDVSNIVRGRVRRLWLRGTPNSLRRRKLNAGRELGFLPEADSMQIQYLEIVTPEVEATCATYEQLHGVSFSAPEAGLGGARTASLPGGGLIGVRAPMRDTEEPVIRPYWLVTDVAAAVEAAQSAGAEIAHPPMEIPGHGTFAIYIQGGIQNGFWQV